MGAGTFSLTGVTVQWTGYVIPYIVLSGTCSSISSGLISAFSPTTSTSKWIGYQILNGAGRGLGMQMVRMTSLSSFRVQSADRFSLQPLIAVQAALNPEDVPIGMSIVVFVQSLGTAITLAVSDVIFQGSLVSELSKQAPLADAAAIVAAGATSFRNIVNDRDLPGVLMAYSIAIDRVFYLVAGVGGLAVLTSLFLGWVNVRKEVGTSKNEPGGGGNESNCSGRGDEDNHGFELQNMGGGESRQAATADSITNRWHGTHQPKYDRTIDGHGSTS
jgi:hypothetical protein